MNSKTDERSPRQPPKPRNGYYDGKKLVGLFRIKPGETERQFAERVVRETLAKAIKPEHFQPPPQNPN